jgi:hypothetical protein
MQPTITALNLSPHNFGTTSRAVIPPTTPCRDDNTAAHNRGSRLSWLREHLRTVLKCIAPLDDITDAGPEELQIVQFETIHTIWQPAPETTEGIFSEQWDSTTTTGYYKIKDIYGYDIYRTSTSNTPKR